jgi:prepilin-type processing-associated H-X9-DG protein
MSEQAEIKTAERPEKPPFQFGLKHLLALPVVVAVFFSVASYWGLGAAFSIVWILAAVFCTAGLFCSATRRMSIVGLALLATAPLLLPARSACPTAARRTLCANNLKQISLALLAYENNHGMFPPAYIADENGRPMHSWRVLILPYLDPDNIYGRYNFDEPWDGPNNSKLADMVPDVFTCPDDKQGPDTMTSYVAVVGPDTAWPGSDQTSLDDFTDGSSHTILLVEIADSGIHWMEPRDLLIEQAARGINPSTGKGISSFHPGGANAAFADGHIEYLPDTTVPEDLRAMLTPAGSEAVDIHDAMD